MTYMTADGFEVKCDRGPAVVSIELEGGDVVRGVCPVAFWPDDSGQCVGATTLQVLMLGIDVPNERLIKVSTGRRGWAGAIED